MHFDYGLGGAEVKSGAVGPLKTMDEFAAELGHTFLHVLKIDVEQSERAPKFVNVSQSSIWRHAAVLQLEIHPSGPNDDFLRLFSELEEVGFSLFHVEANMIYPLRAIILESCGDEAVPENPLHRSPGRFSPHSFARPRR
jgi:hypothetical protein